MKHAAYSILFMAFLLSCNSNHNQIGKIVDTQKAISIQEALKKFEKGEKVEYIVYGKVMDVCQSEGCWFAYETEDSSITVDFNDAFTVPKTIKRKDLYAIGAFYKDTTQSEDSLKSMIIETKFLATGVKFK